MHNIRWQPKLKSRTTKFSVILIAATAVVVGLCVLLVYQIKSTTAEETERYLSELSSSGVYSVDARLQANLDALESIALTYVERKKLGLEEDLSYLQRKAEVHKFVSVFVMSPNGEAIGSDGNTYDFSDSLQIMQTLDGKRSVMNDALIYGETQNGFAYAVPIYEENEITGALVAANSTEWIKSLLSQTYFDGDGFFHIIDAKGDFIVKSNNPYAMAENKNFLLGLEQGAQFNYESSLDQVKELIATNQMGTIYFTMKADHVPKIGKAIPLSDSGFYLFLVVTESAANRQFDALLVKAVLNNIIIALLLASVVFIVLAINFHNSKQLAKLAFVDPVTDGYSQIRFETEAQAWIQAAPAGKYTFVSLNVANFKLINDTFSVDDGNRILYHIHHEIRDFLKEDALLCRSFSDNFDLLLKTDTKDRLLSDMSQIVRRINAFNHDSSQKYYLYLTVGIYQIDDPNLSIVHIRDRANVARKSNKRALDNDFLVCTFYSDWQRQRQLRNKDLENKMNDALKKGEFVVFFQPKVRLSDQKIAGAEALVRWRDPEWGLIPPSEFIPFFEQNHFIVQLDLYVFEQVCIYLRSWIDAGMEPVPISVNLSRVHLKDKDFLLKFSALQQKYKIPPKLLEMELTETALSENLDLVIKAVNEIHQLGFCCSIDDFGSGYSSLNLIKNINADTLKLDKAFFGSPKADDSRERAIIVAVIEMAKKLNMTTLAEGVETLEQLDFLKEIRCDMVQGFVISKPIEANRFEQLLFEHERRTEGGGV